jgi:hypothetical protein
MANGIHESLQDLAVDIDTLVPLEDNPRHGNVSAIMASYQEFGQIKPIVVRPNSDGTSTVIAGNHQLEAAKRLGWDQIAVVEYDVDDKRAIAFALTDNRTMELGYTEPEMLGEIVTVIVDSYPELINDLGWDEFSVAEIEQKIIRSENQVIDSSSSSYVPPVISSSFTGNGFSSTLDEDDEGDDTEERSPVRPQSPTMDLNAVSITRDRDGNQQINIRPGMDQDDAVIRGSTTVMPGAAPQAIVQYTLVFDNPQQQARWYEFIKWLRSDPAIVGTTTAEKLIDFINQHIEI